MVERLIVLPPELQEKLIKSAREADEHPEYVTGQIGEIEEEKKEPGVV